MPLTPAQEDRRLEFIHSINAGIAAGTIQDQMIQNANLHMVASFVDSWNEADWSDLPDEARNELSSLVMEFRESIRQFNSGREQIKQNISQLSLLRLGQIRTILSDNGIKVTFP